MSRLKMHEAILAGASAIRAKSGVQYETQPDGTVVGCALGMANVANGAIYGPRKGAIKPGENPRSEGTSLVWGQWVKKLVRRPCDCTHKTEKEMDDEAYRLTHQQPADLTLDPMSDVFSWMNYCRLVADRRTGVPVFKLLEHEMAIEDIIPHLFDNHVLAGQIGDGGRREREQEGYDGFNWIAPKPWTIEQLADWVKTVEDAAEKEREEKDALAWGCMPMPYPANWGPIYHYVGIDWAGASGAVAPGNDIPDLNKVDTSPLYRFNPDGSITNLSPSPLLGGYEGAMASNAGSTPPMPKTEITIAMLQEAVAKVEAAMEGKIEKEDLEEAVKISPAMRKVLGLKEGQTLEEKAAGYKEKAPAQ